MKNMRFTPFCILYYAYGKIIKNPVFFKSPQKSDFALRGGGLRKLRTSLLLIVFFYAFPYLVWVKIYIYI